MIHNEPPRIPNSKLSRLPKRPTEGSNDVNQPAFPRSSWADKSSLSDSLREAISKMRYDFSDYFNWRRPSNPPNATFPPTAMPMYGMPNPGNGGQLPVSPNPPSPMPMYGMPNPGNGGSKPLPPDLPGLMPMYGMPNPGNGGSKPLPTDLPGLMPMYGMPNPGNGGQQPILPNNPPTNMPMYGMPNP